MLFLVCRSGGRAVPLGESASEQVARTLLKSNARREFEINTSAAHNHNQQIYEKVSLRFNRSCGGFVTAQPERSSALGLLSSLLWLPPRLLAPLLARGLLVWRLLASRLLVPGSSRSRGPVLIWPHRRGSARGSPRNFSRGSLLHGVVQAPCLLRIHRIWRFMVPCAAAAWPNKDIQSCGIFNFEGTEC
jgi:hypothetical protein